MKIPYYNSEATMFAQDLGENSGNYMMVQVCRLTFAYCLVQFYTRICRRLSFFMLRGTGIPQVNYSPREFDLL